MQLLKTNLFLEDDTLIKMDKDGQRQASFDLDSIRTIEVSETKEYGGALILALLACGLAYASKRYIPSEGWSWAVCITFVALAAFSMMLAKVRSVKITTDEGEVSYPISDQFEEADGFVLAVKHALADRPRS